MKKLLSTAIIVLLLSQGISGIALASDATKISYQFINWDIDYIRDLRFFDYVDIHDINSLEKDNYVYDINIIRRDLTKDGKKETIVTYYNTDGQKYIDIYTNNNEKKTLIFSGKGYSINVQNSSFSITNIKYDSRYFYETYTYQWRNNRFLKTGYAKTYIKNGCVHEKPVTIKNDERILTVKNFLKARMQKDFTTAKNYLTENYKNKTNEKELYRLIPQGKVTTIDIFDSSRGDWVVVVIRDKWGQSRVFKFVPKVESDKYSNTKIDFITEIPKAN